MKRSDWMIALTLALSTVVIAACGSGASGGGDQASREEAQLEFAECMREHGVEMPDPKPGQEGMLFGTTRGGPSGESKTTTGINPEDPATKKALRACESKLPESAQKLSPQQEEKFKEAALAFSQCMREHGVDMPDPQFGGKGKVTMKIEKGDIDPSSPAFEEAQEACRKTVPGGPVIGAPPSSR
jgi:hypothetical protein